MEEEKSFLSEIEETLIAIILGIMTLITFANVVTRYLFNSNILWALEVTVFLFAWLVLLGASYALKIKAHLGVDAILNIVSPGTRSVLSIIAGVTVLAFTGMMFKGAWDYWANFANLPETSGRWFPTGFDWEFRGKAWLETTSTPMPEMFRFLEAWINEGERYDKLPRVIPYAVLPLGMGLLFLRSVQMVWKLWTGSIDMLIASHEAEDSLTDTSRSARGN